MASSSSALAHRPADPRTGRPSAPRPYREWATLATRPLRDHTRVALRWLRADVEESLTMRRRAARASAPPRAEMELRESLRVWDARLRRRRAAVLARRHLTAALGVTIAAELVVVLAGGDRRGWWLLAPLAVAGLDGALALRRATSPERVAHMLDRALGLHDLLVTAYAIAVEERHPRGLAALVVRDGTVVAAESLASVAIAARSPRRESSLLAAGVVLLAVLVAVPGLDARSSARHAASTAARVPSTGAAGTHAKPGKPAPSASRQRLPRASSTPLPQTPLALATGESAHRKSSGFSPYGHGASSLSAKQLAHEGIASPPPATTRALGALAVGEAGGAPAAGGASTHGSRSAAAGSNGTPGSAAGAAAARGASSATGGALSAAHSHSAPAPGAGGARQAGGGTGGASTGASPPGGSSAGTGLGSSTLASGLVPVLGTGRSGLPLQAGYAPSGTRRSPGGEGISQTPNGGGSGGRSANAAGGAATSVSSSLSVIPPSPSSAPALDQGVLASYFGSANQLTPGDW
jgi:hypothetical protein